MIAYQCLLCEKCSNNWLRWMDSKWRLLVLRATALPIVPLFLNIDHTLVRANYVIHFTSVWGSIESAPYTFWCQSLGSGRFGIGSTSSQTLFLSLSLSLSLSLALFPDSTFHILFLFLYLCLVPFCLYFPYWTVNIYITLSSFLSAFLVILSFSPSFFQFSHISIYSKTKYSHPPFV